MAIVAQPALAVVLQLVTGGVVDDEGRPCDLRLATVVTPGEWPQELEERGPLNTSAKRNMNLAVSSATEPKMCAVLRAP